MAKTAEPVRRDAADGRWITVLQGIRPYDRTVLTRDVVAGITLAALAIPEVMGYTKIAGTPVVSGLYTILIPAVVFALLGSSRHLVVGGDSATAAIVYAGIAGLGVAGLQPGTQRWLAYASLAALITGAMLLVARVARLGFLADFISRTVLIGFLTGVGIQVAASQLPGILGVAPPNVAANETAGTVVRFWDTLKEIGDTSLTTFVVSLAVIATLIVFKRWVRAVPGGLVAIVGVTLASWAFDLKAHGVVVLGNVPSGFPHLGLPDGIDHTKVVPLLATSVSMFLVILAQSAATSRAFAVKHDDRVVENNDLVGLSIANIAAGLSSTFVVNGSPTKTEVADEAGGRTQVTMLTMAAVTAAVLLFATRPLEYLPNAALAAVVFVVGIKLIDLLHMRRIASVRRDEFIIAAITAVVVVAVGVEQGIVLAVVLSLLDHVRRHYDPHDSVVVFRDDGARDLVPVKPGVMTEPGLVIYRFGVGLFYANAARLAQDVLDLVSSAEQPRWVVLLAEAIDDVDYTGGATLLELVHQLHRRGIVFAIAEPTPTVREEIARLGLLDAIGADHVFAKVRTAVAAFHASPERAS